MWARKVRVQQAMRQVANIYNHNMCDSHVKCV